MTEADTTDIDNGCVLECDRSAMYCSLRSLLHTGRFCPKSTPVYCSDRRIIFQVAPDAGLAVVIIKIQLQPNGLTFCHHAMSVPVVITPPFPSGVIIRANWAAGCGCGHQWVVDHEWQAALPAQLTSKFIIYGICVASCPHRMQLQHRIGSGEPSRAWCATSIISDGISGIMCECLYMCVRVVGVRINSSIYKTVLIIRTDTHAHTHTVQHWQITGDSATAAATPPWRSWVFGHPQIFNSAACLDSLTDSILWEFQFSCSLAELIHFVHKRILQCSSSAFVVSINQRSMALWNFASQCRKVRSGKKRKPKHLGLFSFLHIPAGLKPQPSWRQL